VAGDDARLFVITGGVPGQLEDLGRQVLEDGSQIHGGTGSHTGGVAALLEEAGDTAHGELKTSLGGTGNALLSGTTASLSFASHIYRGDGFCDGMEGRRVGRRRRVRAGVVL